MHVSFRGMGFAAFVSAALVVGSSVVGQGQAFAFGSPGVAALTASSPLSFAAGTASQPANNVSLLFTDSSTAHVWSAGDRVTFQLWDSTSNGPLSNTSSNTLDSAAFAATPSVAATNGVTSAAYSVALQPSATSTVNDEFTLTFNQDAPEDTNTTAITVSGLSISLGANVPLGHGVSLKATASNGSPFTGAVATKTVLLGSIPSVTVTNSQIATGGPSGTGVALGNVVLRDVAGGAVSSGDEIDLTLAYGAKFTTAGTVDGTLVATGAPAIVTVNTASDTVKTTAVKTSAAGDALELTGAVVTLPATATEVYLAISDETTAAFLGAVGVATVVNQSRLGGSDRYATASLLYDSVFAAATSVVLTSGANYPDALSASYLARQLFAGVLTTDPGSLPSATKQELLAHSISTVYIVGGTAAVSQNVLNEVAALHVGNSSTNPLINVVRIAGSDRFATNNLVDIYHLPAVTTTAVIATGLNFADALAVGPAITATGDPLILTSGSSLSASAMSTIDNLGIKHAIIIGGTSAVSSALESALTAAGITVSYRIAGADRTQTAASVATWETGGLPASGAYPALPGLGFSTTTLINVARGDSFADALVAGPVAGESDDVIVLTASANTLGDGIPTFLAGKGGLTTLRALGLTSAVSAATLNAAAATLTKPLII